MKILISLILSLWALSFGMLVSAAVLTVFVAVGLVPRFAQKTKTADRVVLYENAVVLGTICGGLVTVFSSFLRFPNGAGWFGILLMIIYGVFGGIFEGCAALAIAEMLDSIPIFARRAGFHQGFRAFVSAVALGKFTGSFLYFLYQWYQFGGM